ncbi:MAG: SDR family NAD(P)-dependent oxidoreductase [Lachnospiraceae bacterium]
MNIIFGHSVNNIVQFLSVRYLFCRPDCHILFIFILYSWINNAGSGNYSSIWQHDLDKIQKMLHLNIEALTILSSLFVRGFKDTEGTQLINVSSCGGYTIVPNAITYCASKFYVSVFTEGLAWELKETGAKMQAKVLAPAATKTEFGKIANNTEEYDYNKMFKNYHTSAQVAGFLMELYDSNKTAGIVDRKDFSFHLSDPEFPYAKNPLYNQNIMQGACKQI